MRGAKILALAVAASLAVAGVAQAGGVFYTESATGNDAMIAQANGSNVTVRWSSPYGGAPWFTRHSVDCSGETVINHNLAWSSNHVYEISAGSYASPGAENFSYDLFYTYCYGQPNRY